MIDNRLRYEINNWSQITKCQSNSSKNLHLKYAQVIDKNLSGQIIRVEHDKYGCLFAYLVEGSGKLLMESDDGMYHEWAPDDILKELEKYGFYIRFARSFNIDGDQIELLMTLQGLHMDKIRFLPVAPDQPDPLRKIGPVQTKLIAFKIGPEDRLLDNRYVCSESRFAEMLIDGFVMNLTDLIVVKRYNWKFLDDKVLDIDSILGSLNSEVIEC